LCYPILAKLNKSATLNILGDVNFVLDGKVSSSNLHSCPLPSFLFALGAGTFTDERFLGETFICNGCAHVCFIDETGKLKTGMNPRPVKTPFLMGITQEMHPNILLHAAFKEPKKLETIYSNLVDEYPLGFACLIDGLFSSLASTYLKKPPIYGEKINEHEDKYWAHTEHLADQRAVLFGVVITAEGKKKFTPNKVTKAFYQNPKEKSSASFMSHTHGGFINEPLKIPAELNSFFSQVSSYQIEGVRHILTQSICKEGVIAVYKIEELTTIN